MGVRIGDKYTTIKDAKVRNFKEKVKKITRRNSPVNLEKVIKDLNPVLRGFSNYFRIANRESLYVGLSKWIRRRLRCKQMELWKKPKRLHRRLRQLGYRGEFKKIRMQSWRNSRSPLGSYALPNKYFAELGLYDLGAVQTGIPVSWK